MENSSSTNWFETLKKKMSSLYNTIKGTPDKTTSILPAVSGGSKKKISKKHKKSIQLKDTKRVRFSKKHKVYTLRRYKK